jgi:hypothetical protein
VRDGFDRSPLAQVSVSLLNVVIATTDSAGRFSAAATVPSGSIGIEFRRSGFVEQFTLVSAGSAPVLDVLLPRSCTTPASGVDGNGNNHNLQLTSTPDALYFHWAPSNEAVRTYWIEVRNYGTEPALLLMPPNIFAQSTGGQAFYRWNTPNSGNYWVVYRTQNDCGLSAPSNVVFVHVQ